MQEAPLYTDLPLMPKGGKACWLHTVDGIKIRAGIWKKPKSKGTVFVLPGRTEWVEKYGPAATEFMDRGFSALAIDWRGQGLADRLLEDRNIGHVGAFADYQKDLAAVIDLATGQKMPKPWFLVGHSMGGAIGMRTLIEETHFQAASFSAPMWGIGMTCWQKTMARLAAPFFVLTGGMNKYAPGTRSDIYTDTHPFEGNSLTTDPEMYAFMRAHTAAHPELSIGGPSTQWVYEGLAENDWAMSQPAPDVPIVCFLGHEERIVDTDAVHKFSARLPQGELIEVPRARHEFPMECPDIRNMFYDRTCAHFAQTL